VLPLPALGFADETADDLEEALDGTEIIGASTTRSMSKVVEPAHHLGREARVSLFGSRGGARGRLARTAGMSGSRPNAVPRQLLPKDTPEGFLEVTLG
jgi:hypothetical protein